MNDEKKLEEFAEHMLNFIKENMKETEKWLEKKKKELQNSFPQSKN